MKKLGYFIKNHISYLIPLILIIGIYLIYKYIYPDPRNWYDHYIYLAKAIMSGRVDIPDLPTFYHDKLEIGGKFYIPFPPGASLLLIPFLYLKDTIEQQQISILIGAIDAGLIYLLLKKFTNKFNSLLLSIFFCLGTPFFWSAIVGTTWYFAHVVAIFFITISFILHFNNKHLFSGIFFALAALTRLPMVVIGIFFAFQLWGQKRNLILFLAGAFIFIPTILGYDWLRFGSFHKTGYYEVYQQYIGGSYPYTILQKLSPNTPYFNYIDIKNVPLHLYTFLLMPPNINIEEGIVKSISPSPFGMGILFTSPLLLIALIPNFKKKLERNLFISALFTSLPSFLHYMQGWVQFGYRFVLDFIVFLMIILAIRFKPTKLNLQLILFSVVVNFWGVLWAIELGW